MQIGSACSGECCLCSHGGGCIAGHGDDYFSYADEEKIFMNLKLGRYPHDREIMLKYLGISEKAVETFKSYSEIINLALTIDADPETFKKIADKIIANRKKREEQMTEEQREQRIFLDFLTEKAEDFINLVRECAPKNEDGTMKGFSFAVPLDEPTESPDGLKCHMLMLKVYKCDEDLPTE